MTSGVCEATFISAKLERHRGVKFLSQDSERPRASRATALIVTLTFGCVLNSQQMDPNTNAVDWMDAFQE